MKNLNVNAKYYTTRAMALQSGEYYTTIKNQSLAQSGFYTFAVPRCVIQAYDTSASSLIFKSRFYLGADFGELQLTAGEEDVLSGTWKGISINGSAALADNTSNPIKISEIYFSSGVSFIAGYNTIEGTFVLTSGSEDFSITGYFTNSWEL